MSVPTSTLPTHPTTQRRAVVSKSDGSVILQSFSPSKPWKHRWSLWETSHFVGLLLKSAPTLAFHVPCHVDCKLWDDIYRIKWCSGFLQMKTWSMPWVPEICGALNALLWVCTDLPCGLPCQEAWLWCLGSRRLARTFCAWEWRSGEEPKWVLVYSDVREASFVLRSSVQHPMRPPQLPPCKISGVLSIKPWQLTRSHFKLGHLEWRQLSSQESFGTVDHLQQSVLNFQAKGHFPLPLMAILLFICFGYFYLYLVRAVTKIFLPYRLALV